MLVPWMIVVALLFSAGPPQEHEHAAPEKLGTVRFGTSCSAAAQPAFTRGVALLHSFDFGRSVDAFNSARTADPSCAIADWGVALSRWGNPFAAGLKPESQLRAGSDAITAARSPAAKTERERGYIDAAALLYADRDRLTQDDRVRRYRDAMAALAARYPSDEEASIFYAVSLAFAADPADKTYASQLKSGSILERLAARHPDHPGLAHYIIHAYDVPPLAKRALAAARRYAAIAPSAPHALHMPSHTFTRLGYWQESIDTNIASAASAKREGATAEELHASDYQTYAYLQSGQDTAAIALMATLPDIERRFDPDAIGAGGVPAAGFFALAAIPARVALERAAWADAAALTPKPSPFPFTEAMTYFARAIGAAHRRDAASIRDAIDALAKIRERLTQAHEDYWAEQVEIQRRASIAQLAFAEGRLADAIADMRTAAAREDATEKNALTPGPIAPARELLGYILFEAAHPADALREFEATLVKEPNRFRAVAGAAKAAAAAGDRAKAAAYYTQLLRICARGDAASRPELVEARAFVP